MKNKLIKYLFLGLLGFVSCEESLDVQNENQPDFKKVYASGSDVENVASGLYNTFYNKSLSYYGTQMPMAVAADNASCSWGNSAMRDMSWEPRKAWNNTPGYSYGANTKYIFDNMYAVINTSSLILKAILNEGIEIGANGVDTDRTIAFCRFNMGVAYATLALQFDQAFIVDEVIVIEDAVVEDASPYTEVAAKAIEYLNAAIQVSQSNDFTIPSGWMGTSGDLSSSTLAKYANSWAARLLSGLPRNSSQNTSVDWTKVLNYANNGLTEDFNVVNDGGANWYAMAQDYLSYPGWGVVDMYVVNKLDPTKPAHWDDDPAFPSPGESTNPDADARLYTDFEYLPSNWLRSDRGFYHWSTQRFSRRDNINSTNVGPLPEFSAAENDLYKAEANAQSGNLAAAVSIINNGTRTSRGKLPAISANLADIMGAIHHERVIELMLVGSGLQFYEFRKNNFLQKGTPLHFPIPAKTLETFGIVQPFYTFGGPDGADGVNGSNGGWR